MNSELDLAGAASAGGWLRWRRRHALPPGSLCRNCATVLRGPFCDQCGQLGEDFHRSAHHLAGEFLEGFFEADGRVFHTLPRLLLRPGQLTSDYIHGKRAPQIPPFRLFITMLLVLFLAGSLRSPTHFTVLTDLNPTDRAEVLKGLDQAQIGFAAGGKPGANTQFGKWLVPRLKRSVEDPRGLVDTMGEWAHRFAFLTLPLSAVLLALLFAGRGFYLFDHLIFSMHSLSLQGFVVTLVILTAGIGGGVSFWLLAAAPVHLYFHMRGTYRTGIAGTLVRMALLGAASTILFGLLMLGLIALGLQLAPAA